eukprot:m.1035441 g.1035441  ORF g.1035441 m.1035441 type:complete len:450 (+) comp24138_c2_seq5:121-1470(+)
MRWKTCIPLQVPASILLAMAHILLCLSSFSAACTSGMGSARGMSGVSFFFVHTHTFPAMQTVVPDYAFEGCSNLHGVIFSNSITRIGRGAFQSCTTLQEIDIVDSVLFIASQAFEQCISLSSVTIGNSVTWIGYEAFRRCDELTTVRIGDALQTIEILAFSYCEKLRTINIPDSVETIGSNAFNDCYCSSALYVSGARLCDCNSCPTESPTMEPTDTPISSPTDAPTSSPTGAPTSSPSDAPTTPSTIHTASGVHSDATNAPVVAVGSSGSHAPTASPTADDTQTTPWMSTGTSSALLVSTTAILQLSAAESEQGTSTSTVTAISVVAVVLCLVLALVAIYEVRKQREPRLPPPPTTTGPMLVFDSSRYATTLEVSTSTSDGHTNNAFGEATEEGFDDGRYAALDDSSAYVDPYENNTVHNPVYSALEADRTMLPPTPVYSHLHPNAQC